MDPGYSDPNGLLRGSLIFGPKMGAFTPNIHGNTPEDPIPEPLAHKGVRPYDQEYTQDVHDTRAEIIAQGNVKVRDGKVKNEQPSSTGQRKVKYSAAQHIIKALAAHDPHHPIVTRGMAGVQAGLWLAQKSAVTALGAEGSNLDFVDGANAVLHAKYGKPVFDNTGRRTDAVREKPQKTGLAVRAGESPERLARGEPGAFHRVYVSPSTLDRSTEADAEAQLARGDAEAVARFASRLPAVTGGQSGVGYWKDGAEASHVAHVSDPKLAGKIGALLGLKHRQKAVLTFTEGPGGDAAHVLLVPGSTPQAIHDGLLRHGVEFKTVIPAVGGHEVHVVDVGNALGDGVRAFAKESGADVRSIGGSAEFIGGDTREEGAEAFRARLRKT